MTASVLIEPVLTSGTKSAPREIMLENSILPKDPGFVRVSTPPRVISLAEHHFPSATDLPREGAEGKEHNEHNYDDDYEPRSLDSVEDLNGSMQVGNRQRFGQGSRGGAIGGELQKRATFSKHSSELVVGRR